MSALGLVRALVELQNQQVRDRKPGIDRADGEDVLAALDDLVDLEGMGWQFIGPDKTVMDVALAERMGLFSDPEAAGVETRKLSLAEAAKADLFREDSEHPASPITSAPATQGGTPMNEPAYHDRPHERERSGGRPVEDPEKLLGTRAYDVAAPLPSDEERMGR